MCKLVNLIEVRIRNTVYYLIIGVCLLGTFPYAYEVSLIGFVRVGSKEMGPNKIGLERTSLRLDLE